jgi:hypothetical protein
MRHELVTNNYNDLLYKYTIELKDLLVDGGINSAHDHWRHRWKGWEYYLWEGIKKTGVKRFNKSTLIKNKVRIVTKKFIDILIDELIDDNAVYVLPNGIGYIAIAQRPINSKLYKYVIKYKQAMPVCYLLLTEKGWKASKQCYKIILSDDNYERMKKKIRSGYEYVTYESLIREVGIELKPKRPKDAAQHKVFRPHVHPEPAESVLDTKTVQ